MLSNTHPLVAKTTDASQAIETEVTTSNTPHSAHISPAARTTRSPTSSDAMETSKQNMVTKETVSMVMDGNMVAIELTSSEGEVEEVTRGSSSDSGIRKKYYVTISKSQ